MPIKYRRRPRHIRRRKVMPRPTRRNTRRVIPRGLRLAVIPIQRDITHFVNSDYGALPTGWAFGTAGSHYHTIQCTQVFRLDMLDDTTDFSNLFKMYKLNCVIVTLTPLHGQSYANGTTTSSQTYFGGNIICYAQKNLEGVALDTGIEQGYWDQTPAKKTYNITSNRSKTFKIYPKVLSQVYLTDTTNQTQSKSSGWLPTTTTGMEVPHYGLNMQFSWADPNIDFRTTGSSTTSAPINFRVNYKFLMQLRGVQ